MKKHTALITAIAIVAILFGNILQAGRYYDAEIGRFTQPDPALQKMHPNKLAKLHNGKLLSTSPYAYGLNNPLRYVDPDGNIVWDVVDAASFGHSAYTFYQNPSWENAGWLALDAVGLLPIIPAVGSIKYIDKAFDAINISETITKKGKTVLGKFPDYLNLADELGAKRFDIPTEIWNKMSKAEQWVANRKFLDRMIARGDEIILSNPVKNIDDVTGSFRQELDYLISKGYKLNEDGSRLIR